MKPEIVNPKKNGGRPLILETDDRDVKRSNREEDDARFEALRSMTKDDLFRQLLHDVANVSKILYNLEKLLKQVVKRYKEDNQNDPSNAEAASRLHQLVWEACDFLSKRLIAPDSQRLLHDANGDMSKKFQDLDDEHQTSYKDAFLDAWERERWFEHFLHDWRWHFAKFKHAHPDVDWTLLENRRKTVT